MVWCFHGRSPDTICLYSFPRISSLFVIKWWKPRHFWGNLFLSFYDWKSVGIRTATSKSISRFFIQNMSQIHLNWDLYFAIRLVRINELFCATVSCLPCSTVLAFMETSIEVYQNTLRRNSVRRQNSDTIARITFAKKKNHFCMIPFFHIFYYYYSRVLYPESTSMFSASDRKSFPLLF